MLEPNGVNELKRKPLIKKQEIKLPLIKRPREKVAESKLWNEEKHLQTKLIAYCVAFAF